VEKLFFICLFLFTSTCSAEGYHAKLMGMLTGDKFMPLDVSERLLSLNQDDPLVGLMGVRFGMSMDEVIDVWGMPNTLEVTNHRGRDGKYEKTVSLGIYISDFKFQNNKLIELRIHLADFKGWKPFGGKLTPDKADADLLKVFKGAKQISKTDNSQVVELKDDTRVKILFYRQTVISVSLKKPTS